MKPKRKKVVYLYATDGRNMFCSHAGFDVVSISPCYHGEADTLLFLHVADAVKKGCSKVCIRTL